MKCLLRLPAQADRRRDRTRGQERQLERKYINVPLQSREPLFGCLVSLNASAVFRHILLLTSLLWTCLHMSAQNTFQGVAKRIPEKEVERQSAFIEADLERQLGHYEKAAEKYRKFLQTYGDEAAAWYGLARVLQAQNDLRSALEATAKAVALDASNPWYKILQADILEKVGQSADAVKVYRELCRQSPENVEFLERLAYLQVLAGQPKDALNTLDQIEKIKGITEAIVDKKHLIYLGMGDVKQAMGELQRLINAYPTQVSYRHRLAQLYESVGNTVAARKVYEEILRLAPDDEAAKMALFAERKSGGSVLADLQALKPIFEDPKISIDSKVKQIIPYLAKMAKGLPPEAIPVLLDLGDIVQKIHPDDPKAWSLSGDLYYHANRYDEALTRYRTCIRLNSRVFSVWANVLEILSHKRDYDELMRLSEQAMDDFPNQPLAYYYYGVAAIEKGRLEEAIAQLEQAELMTVNNLALALDIADQRGRALLLKKEYLLAQKHYEPWLTKGGDRHPGILEHYGDVLFWLGQQEKAIEYWRKAAQLAPSPRLEQKVSSGRL